MIEKRKAEVSIIGKGAAVINSIYRGAVLVWEAVRSCFGSGIWVNDKMWVNKEPWSNN